MLEEVASKKVKKVEKERGQVYWLFKNTFSALLKWSKKHWFLSILIIIALTYILVTGRAIYQPLFLGIRKYFALLILIILICVFLVRIFSKSLIVGKILSATAILIFVAGSVLFGRNLYEYVGLFIHYQNLDKVALAKLPVTANERIHPLNSVKTLTEQEALSETEETTRPMFIRRRDGRFDFSMCIGPSPEYTAQRLQKNMYRVISVPATTPAPDFSAGNQFDVNFDLGEFLLFSKNTRTGSIKSFSLGQYFSCEPGEPFFIEDDQGNWIQVVPITRWKGVLIPRPVFGGVILFEQIESTTFNRYVKRVITGVGEFVKPKEISRYSYLRGQHLLPIKVSRFIAESFRFQEGFLAPMPGYHEGDIRIPDMPEDQNEQPFFTYFDLPGSGGKLCSYFGLEPFQESKRGLNTSLIIPGDGEELVYYMDHSSKRDALIGSSAIPSKVIESKKNYDWSKNHPAESRPFIKNINGKSRFFWLNTVVTNMDDSGESFIGGTIPDVTITDAKYGRVVWIGEKNLIDSDLWVDQVEDELSSIWNK